MLFVDPIETNIPNPTSLGVLFYGPGYYTIGTSDTPMKLTSGTTVYVAGGCYISGNFVSDMGQNNITIMGRGILSGDRIKSCNAIVVGSCTENMVMINLQGFDIVVEGITVVNAPFSVVQINAWWYEIDDAQTGSAIVDNVKVMAWYYATDGIYGGSNSVIRNSFIRVNDDATKEYLSNTLIEGLTIWQLDNGSPFVLSWNVGYGGIVTVQNVIIRDCIVLHVEHEGDAWWGLRAVFTAIHGGSASLQDQLFENIVVEAGFNGGVFRAFGIGIHTNPWSTSIAVPASISGIRFNNIVFVNGATHSSNIFGFSPAVKVCNIHFQDVFMGNSLVNNATSLPIYTDPTTTCEITFGSASSLELQVSSPATDSGTLVE